MITHHSLRLALDLTALVWRFIFRKDRKLIWRREQAVSKCGKGNKSNYIINKFYFTLEI